MRDGLAPALALLLTLFSGDAFADPQTSVGVTTGFALTNLRDDSGPRPAFHLGIRGDWLVLRNREKDMAIGPYVEALTERFNSIDVGGGVEWLIPIIPSYPFVVSAGGYGRAAPGYGAVQPGIATELWFGPRSLNFFSSYGLANGVFVQSRYGLGDTKQGDILFGVQLDLALFALPWILTYESLAH